MEVVAATSLEEAMEDVVVTMMILTMVQEEIMGVGLVMEVAEEVTEVAVQAMETRVEDMGAAAAMEVTEVIEEDMEGAETTTTLEIMVDSSQTMGQ